MSSCSIPAARATVVANLRDQEPEGDALSDTLFGRRILLAEDHPVNRRVVELILAPFGVALTVASDGREALDRLAAERFDLVLMDMQMPVIDGLTATRRLRAREAEEGLARTPVLMLSANAMRQHRDDSRAAGADRHVAKPVTAQALIAAMVEELAR